MDTSLPKKAKPVSPRAHPGLTSPPIPNFQRILVFGQRLSRLAEVYGQAASTIPMRSLRGYRNLREQAPEPDRTSNAMQDSRQLESAPLSTVVQPGSLRSVTLKPAGDLHSP
jgi:hypothetical protein